MEFDQQNLEHLSGLSAEQIAMAMRANDRLNTAKALLVSMVHGLGTISPPARQAAVASAYSMAIMLQTRHEEEVRIEMLPTSGPTQ